MAEIPGITPKVAQFARTVREEGFTVVLPHLFGAPGRDPDPPAPGKAGTAPTMVPSPGRVCVSRAFSPLATGRAPPVIPWVLALAVPQHRRSRGPGAAATGRV